MPENESMLSIKILTFNPLQENTYVLSDQKDASVIIDPGAYFEEEKAELLEALRSEGLIPNRLLNTHCHLDHIFSNQLITDVYGCTLEIGEFEQRTLDFAPAAGERWGLPVAAYVGPVIYLKEGDIIHIGEDELEVFFTPGHSEGHVVFYCRKQGFVIGGDVLFRGGIGRTDLPGGDHALLMKSIREKLLTLPDETVVWPGHGEETTIGWEKMHNMFLQ